MGKLFPLYFTVSSLTLFTDVNTLRDRNYVLSSKLIENLTDFKFKQSQLTISKQISISNEQN